MIRDDIDRAINMQPGYWSELYKSIWAIVPSFGYKYIALDYRSNQPKKRDIMQDWSWWKQLLLMIVKANKVANYRVKHGIRNWWKKCKLSYKS